MAGAACPSTLAASEIGGAGVSVSFGENSCCVALLLDRRGTVGETFVSVDRCRPRTLRGSTFKLGEGEAGSSGNCVCEASNVDTGSSSSAIGVLLADSRPVSWSKAFDGVLGGDCG